MLGAIVEGHGEVAAVPVLLRRIAAEMLPLGWADVRQPFRIGRSSVVKEGALEHALEQVLTKHGPCHGILVLLDADDDCPASLGPTLQNRAAKAVGQRARVSVVFADREFESWFLASAESLAGFRGLPTSIEAPTSSESRRDAKGWLSGKLGTPPYRASHDQAGFTSRFDMKLAERNSRSFRKLSEEVRYLLTGAHNTEEG